MSSKKYRYCKHLFRIDRTLNLVIPDYEYAISQELGSKINIARIVRGSIR